MRQIIEHYTQMSDRVVTSHKDNIPFRYCVTIMSILKTRFE